MTTTHTTTQQGATPIVVLPTDVYATPSRPRGRDAGGSVFLPDGGPPASAFSGSEYPRADLDAVPVAEPALALGDTARRKRDAIGEGR